MAARESIDSDSSDSNQMKIVEPSNEVDPSPLPPPLPQPPPTSNTIGAVSSVAPSTSPSSSQQPTPPSTDLSPSHQQSTPTPQESNSPSSPPSQVLNNVASEDPSKSTDILTTSTTNTTDTASDQPREAPMSPVTTSPVMSVPEETSVTHIETNLNSLPFESTTNTDGQPEPMTNNSIEDIEVKGDTANGLISNNGNSTTESEIVSSTVQPKSHGRKRSIDEVTRDPQEVTPEREPKKLVTHQPKSEKKSQQQNQSTDDYCWVCHKEKSNISCKSCPRTYHLKCVPTENSGLNDASESKHGGNNSNWICIECSAIMKSEDSISKNPALSHLNPHEFSELLTFAVQTIKATADRSFHQPVSEDMFPDYRHFVVHPMDFSTIEMNIRSRAYASTDALMAEIKYIVHNCYIYNSPNHPLTKNANYFMKVAKNEMQEIEICPNCCRNFYTLKDKEWFAEPCARPHILVHAKMRGYPPWPAKVVRYDKDKNEVDVRFFGAHDRSWVPVDQCSLLTKPANFTPSKGAKGAGKGLKSRHDSALAELTIHVKRLNELFPSKFHYAKAKQPIDVNKLFICDGPETEEMPSEMDDDRDSDLNDDKLVIDETGDDPEASANESIEQKGIKNEKMDISSDVIELLPSVPEKPVKSEPLATKMAIPKSTKNSLRSPQVQKSPQQAISASPKKEETPRSAKRKPAAKTKKEVKSKEKDKDKEKEKSDNEKVMTPPSIKKTEPRKKVVPKPAIEEEAHNKILDELETLKKKMEFEKMMHREQLKEIEHNHNLKIREMRDSWQAENDRAIKSLTATLDEKHRKEIDETKKKLWCSECLKEAIYFCCWNTSYCSLECQKAQWPKHAAKCQQQSHWQQTNSQPSVNQQPSQQSQQNQQQSQPQLQSHNNNTSYGSTINQQA